MVRAPRVTPLRWLIGRLVRLVPEAILSRVLPGPYRYDPRRLPAPPAPPDAPTRLWVAPVNWAGQGWQWGRAAERHLSGVRSHVMAYALATDGFRFESDTRVPAGAYAFSSRWQRAEQRAVTAGFTHVLLEAERRPFGAIIDGSVDRQVDDLQRAGIAVALVCHGSDIRLPSRHARREADSPFHQLSPAQFARTERAVARNAAVIARLGLPTFVSTPDLFDDVPNARWLPVIVDVPLWLSDEPALRRAVPIVVHAPSKGAVKGSDLVDPVMQRLADEGAIEYRRVSGVAASAMPELYRAADIVLDQFRIGGYGVAACEAMAAGRVVIGHVDPAARRAVLAEAGEHLPVVQATGATIDEVVRGIIADRDEARAVAARGPGFVEALHDGRRSAEVLGTFLTPR